MKTTIGLTAGAALVLAAMAVPAAAQQRYEPGLRTYQAGQDVNTPRRSRSVRQSSDSHAPYADPEYPFNWSWYPGLPGFPSGPGYESQR